MKNKHAASLGRLGKGKKKTMSMAAVQQRHDALVKANEAIKRKKERSQASKRESITNNLQSNENNT